MNDELLPSRRTYCPPNFIDCEDENGNVTPETWRLQGNNIQTIRRRPPYRSAQKAFQQRDALTQYFLTPGDEVPWHYEYIQRGRNAA